MTLVFNIILHNTHLHPSLSYTHTQPVRQFLLQSDCMQTITVRNTGEQANKKVRYVRHSCRHYHGTIVHRFVGSWEQNLILNLYTRFCYDRC